MDPAIPAIQPWDKEEAQEENPGLAHEYLKDQENGLYHVYEHPDAG